MKNEFLKAMNFRHACKEFDINKKISIEDFEKILEFGRISPSSFGFEPWKFLIIQNTILREKLKQFSWGSQLQLSTCSHFVLALTRKSNFMKFDSEYVNYIMKDIQKLPEDVIELKSKFYKTFQEKDFNLINNERAMFDWASKQTYIAIANMMTGASFMRIDSCPIEGFEYEEIMQILKKDLNIDIDKFGLSCMIAFGYRTKEPREKTRQPINEIVQWYF